MSSEEHESTEEGIIRPEFQEGLDKIKGIIREFLEENNRDEDHISRHKYVREIFDSVRRAIGRGEFPVCESEAENRELLAYADELEKQGLSLDGDGSNPYYVIGTMLFKDKMTSEDILNLINERKALTLINGLLISGAAEILGLDKADNDAIVDFGKKILEDFYNDSAVINSGSTFEEWKTHNSYLIWFALAKYLKLDGLSLDEIVALGLKYNESHLWPELLSKRKESMETIAKLSPQQREDIAKKIAIAYAPLMERDPFTKDTVSSIIRGGGPVSAVLSMLLGA